MSNNQTMLSIRSIERLPYAGPSEPRWLAIDPNTGDTLMYNSRTAQLFSIDEENFKLHLRTDLSSVLASRYRPRQIKFCGRSGARLLITGSDRKCHLVDAVTGAALADTLGEHEFFAIEKQDKFVYLIDYQQELLVRYNWPSLRNACALSLIRKTDAAMCTVLENLHPWDVVMAGGYPVITKAYGSSSFPENYAAVCLSAHQKLWRPVLEKPEKPSNAAQRQRADKRRPDGDKQPFNRCYGKYWLPGDRYLAWDQGTGGGGVLYMTSPAEGSIYAYRLSEEPSTSEPGKPLQPSFANLAELYLPEAMRNFARPGLDDDFQVGSSRPTSVAFDMRSRLLRVLVGDSHAGVSHLIACELRG